MTIEQVKTKFSHPEFELMIDDLGISFLKDGLYYSILHRDVIHCDTVAQLITNADEVISGCCGEPVDEDRMFCLGCKEHY